MYIKDKCKISSIFRVFLKIGKYKGPCIFRQIIHVVCFSIKIFLVCHIGGKFAVLTYTSAEDIGNKKSLATTGAQGVIKDMFWEGLISEVS